ncbi:MAG: MmcQ/YjbR family DNA-binding protein [Blastocatellia bacterium]
MSFDSIREYCLSLPHVTEDVQWENDLLFRIGNKMFTVLTLDAAASYRMTFKCTPEEFAELIEREDIDPAPYVARYHWVALKRFDALPQGEMKRLIKDSYEMVKGKLPKKVLAELKQLNPEKKTSTKATKKYKA